MSERLNAYRPEFLLENMPIGAGIEERLGGAIDYALKTNGSFSRARLTFAVCLEMGMARESSSEIASSIELFHLASLIFDDLPCMDDAEVRRNIGCLHGVHGESAAILSALAFINRGYALFWKQMNGVDPLVRDDAAALIESSLGVDGILNGQSMDLNFEPGIGGGERVERIALLKTGALFRICLLLPAILAGASRYEKLHLARLSNCWGVAYQVADDLKDVLFSEDISGKTAQKDEELGRPNIALQIGVDRAGERLRGCIQDAEASLRSLESTGGREWACLRSFHKDFSAKVEPILEKQEVA